MQTRSWRQRLRKTALRLVVLYFVVLIVIAGCADRLVLFPSRQPIEFPGAQRVETPGPVGPLEIWTARSRAVRGEPQAFVLHFVGNASRAEGEGQYVLDQWREWPIELWAVNYPGYGGSAGDAKMKWMGPAALAAFDRLKQQAGGRPIFISGRSIGTTAALHVSANRPVAGVILHSPPPLRQLIIGRHGWWNLWLGAASVAFQVPADIDSIANAKRSTAPAIFILTGADHVVPLEYQQRVVDAYAGPKQFVNMPTAGHQNSVYGPARLRFEDCVGQIFNPSIATAEAAHAR